MRCTNIWAFLRSRRGRVDVEKEATGWRGLGYVAFLLRSLLMEYKQIYVGTVANIRIDRWLQWREHRLTRFYGTIPLPVGISYPSRWLLFEKTECSACKSYEWFPLIILWTASGQGSTGLFIVEDEIDQWWVRSWAPGERIPRVRSTLTIK